MSSRLLPFILLFMLCIAACAGKTPHGETAGQAGQPESPAMTQVATDSTAAPCLEAWTYAPGNFVLDVAEGADVYLEPEVQDFPLYCSAAKAREALNDGVAHGELPEANGGWAIFRVEGVFHEIARPAGYERYFLKREARLVDWSY